MRYRQDLESTIKSWKSQKTLSQTQSGLTTSPACGAMMPLVRTFLLSKKKGKKAWIEPIVNKADKTVQYEVRTGDGIPREGTVNRRGAQCIFHNKNSHVQLKYVRSEGKAGRMGYQLIAIVAEGNNGRVYLNPNDDHTSIANKAEPHDVPETELPEKALGFSVQTYGMTQHHLLFTKRQLIALTTFSNLISEVRDQIRADAVEADIAFVEEYADAVVTYLAFAFDKAADYWSRLCSWHTGGFIRNTFARQALAMVWDYAECNPFSQSTGNWQSCIDWVSRFLAKCSGLQIQSGNAAQLDAADALLDVKSPLISTDPPYYDNIGYADLSDFFYVWLRRNLRQIYPELFNLMLVPKTEEMIASRYRFGGNRAKAEEHFLTGLGKAFQLMKKHAHPDYPVTVYYAFKQSETNNKNGGVSSTGWETMLEGLLKAGFQITSTLPMRTEMGNRQVAMGANALASSIVLVCRPRPDDAGMATRRDFISELRSKLPDALKNLQQGYIAPVDLAQAVIGPGMAVFSRYSRVLEAGGNPMRVRTALQIINAELDVYLTEQDGDLDADTRFCVSWFEQYGMEEAGYGEADVLARARDTSVEGISESGILHARAGRVRLLNRNEYPDEWDPSSDSDLNTWKCTQYLIRALDQGGETETARLVFQLGSEQSENARALAYRLYAICDRNGWAQEAIPYNTLVTSWANIQAARKDTTSLAKQQKLLPEES